jgi:hypothetical protein
MDTRLGRVRRAGVGAHLCAFAALALMAGPASAGAAARSGVPVEGWSAARASSFWTPARMRRAVPVQVAGPGAVARDLPRARAAASAEPPSSTTTPHPVAPHSDFAEVLDPTDQVSRTNGAIFFEFKGELGRCSGTSVNAPNLSVVFTAGHCVHEAGGSHSPWYRGRWTFVPGYRFGQRPFGVFPAKWLDATRRWVKEGNENFDVAAAVVDRNEKGQRLGAAVGGTGIAFNRPPGQVFDVHGYPVGRPFDGETQRLCSGAAFLGHDPVSLLFPGPLSLGVPCQVTGGASGGGWTIDGNVLNSVTDYGYPEDPQTAYGAYFGPEVKRLYERVGRFR